MDEDAALAPAAAANTELVPEVRAELRSLAQGARETISKKWSPHTHRAYAGAWSRFREWASARGLESLPADPAILVLYLEHLVQEGRAKTTIRTAASAVSAAHRAGGFSGGNPASHEDVKDFLRGVETYAPPQRQAAAMLPNVISAIRATARIPRRGRGGRMETQGTAEARARAWSGRSPSGTAASGSPRPPPSPGGTWNAGATVRGDSPSASQRATRPESRRR